MNLQEVFNRINESKKEAKKIRDSYKDSLIQSQEHQRITEELKTLREKKKEIENAIKLDFSKEFDRLDTLKTDIENDNLLLSDATLTKFVNGEQVEITDEHNQKYEPIFMVKFKKS